MEDGLLSAVMDYQSQVTRTPTKTNSPEAEMIERTSSKQADGFGFKPTVK